ncbi:MAG: HlyC/CorC family transporter [Clostridia bacterium]|nr:HlyC/CorC family transporter [Clostridia bacterium]
MDPVPLWPSLLLTLGLIALTFILTLLESAAEDLTESRLERMKDEGSDRAASILEKLPRCGGMLSAIHSALLLTALICGALPLVSLTGWLVRAIGVTDVAAWPGSGLFAVCLAAALLVMTALMRLFGRELPRRVAARHADRLVVALFGALRFIQGLFSPLTALVTGGTRMLLRLFGIDPDKADEDITEDEILAMVDIGEENGSIESNEKELIENIFDFSNMTAEDCMIHRTDVTAIDVDIGEDELIDLIRETGFSRFPVYGDDIDDIVGMLTTRSYLLNARLPEGERKTVRELMRPAYFVPETVPTDVLFREMQAKKNHMAIVVDEYGGTSGIITLEDLLEEIVGNIYDEFDPQSGQDIIPLADGSWKVAGSVELEPLCEALGIDEIESEEFDTLGGMVFSQLTTIPDDGSHPEVECYGLHIRVDELTDRRVEWATVRKLDPKAEDSEV